MKISLDVLQRKDIERFNESFRDIIEVLRDTNILLGSLLGRKVVYGKKHDTEKKDLK